MFSRISVLVDNASWILPYAEKLTYDLRDLGLHCLLIDSQKNIPTGDVCFFLGCTKIVEPQYLSRNDYNMVVHESALPQGKGFAPIAWQILKGKRSIPVCLLEAEDTADSGKIWLKENIELVGTELCPTWRELQGFTSINLAKRFILEFENLTPQAQHGNESFYPKRSPKDSELDINKSLAEQFDLLRTVDNKNHPAFFDYRGSRYKLEIYPDE